MNDSLGDRMKNNYEKPFQITLPARMPVIVRVDGKSFHTLLRGSKRPFDDNFSEAMIYTAENLIKSVQTSVLAFQQSDEISLLLHNYKKLDTQPWFDNEVQKIVSIAAASAAVLFNKKWQGKTAVFDARVFVLPEAEVANYFIWRQKDATRNSLQMVAQSLYSHKELHQKKQSDLQKMIFQKGQNWNDYPTKYKRGVAVRRGLVPTNEPLLYEVGMVTDLEVPIFTQDRGYIEDLLRVEQE